mmetsp:Transcript_35828/g.45608  ORF Transcript_35828/g.45608 Transcript_35828/m.45608 type:complete len:116 (+) Transcript_35828:71-418(+)
MRRKSLFTEMESSRRNYCNYQHIMHDLHQVDAGFAFFTACEFLATSFGIIDTLIGVGCSKTGTFCSSKVFAFFKIPWPMQINLILSGLSDFCISFGQLEMRLSLISDTFVVKSVS